MLHFVKSPKILRRLFVDFLWKVNTKEKVIYLTFDDGPHPEITPWLINLLDQHKAKGTFFLLGSQVVKHPGLHQLYLDNGHLLGNHTFRHLRGWQSRRKRYLNDISECAKVVKSKLFRPPYGQIKLNAISRIKKHYKIIMWDVLAWDFDPQTSPEMCLANVLKHTNEGSIVVFHENGKSKDNIMYALPKVLEHFSSLGYQFKAIPKE